RRQQPDQRRLPRAVLPQDCDALAALHRESDVVQRHTPATAEALVLPDELLAQVVYFEGVHGSCSNSTTGHGKNAHHRMVRRCAGRSESAEEQHRVETIAGDPVTRKCLFTATPRNGTAMGTTQSEERAARNEVL